METTDYTFDWVLANLVYEQPFNYTRCNHEWIYLQDEIGNVVYTEAVYLSDAIDYYDAIK